MLLLFGVYIFSGSRCFTEEIFLHKSLKFCRGAIRKSILVPCISTIAFKINSRAPSFLCGTPVFVGLTWQIECPIFSRTRRTAINLLAFNLQDKPSRLTSKYNKQYIISNRVPTWNDINLSLAKNFETITGRTGGGGTRDGSPGLTLKAPEG